MTAPVERPSEWSKLGDHERRLRALEATPHGDVIWVGDDCCLHWICPADGLEYKVCGELVDDGGGGGEEPVDDHARYVT